MKEDEKRNEAKKLAAALGFDWTRFYEDEPAPERDRT